MRIDRTTFRVSLLTLGLLLHAGQSPGQNYPSKPVQIIVPSTAGGGLDLLVKAVQPRLAELLGQPVIIDNVPGAGSMIGIRKAKGAAPDGHTLLMSASSMITNSLVYRTPGYGMNDFVPVGAVATNAYVFIASDALPARTLPELVSYARANPGKLNSATLGAATVLQMCFNRFRRSTGISTVDIPFAGSAPANQAFLAGTVELYLAGSDGLVLRGSGRGRFLAVTSESRLAAAPDIPTFREQGFPEMVCTGWNGILAPRGTPAPVVAKLKAAFDKILAENDVRERVRKIGLDPWTEGSAAFEEFFRRDITKLEQDVKQSGIPLID